MSGPGAAYPSPSHARPAFDPVLPPRVPPTAIDEAVARHRGDLDAFFAELDARGGVFVVDGPDADTATVHLAHPMTDQGTEVFLLVDTITHLLRDRLEHFALTPREVDGTTLLAAAFVLPRALRATTALLVETGRHPDLTRDRDRWRAVYGRTRALGDRAETVRDSAGGLASVLALPGASPAPWIDAESTGALVPRASAAGRRPRASRVHRGVIDSAALGMPVRVWAAVPHPAHGEIDAVVVVADGDHWDGGYPLRAGLERLHDAGACAPTLALFFAPFPTVDAPSARAEVLGMNPRLPDFLADELLPWAASFAPVPTDPARRAIGGASLGGLAAADVVRRAPEAFGAAIVQSGSFWWPGPDGSPGEQLRRWQEDGPALADRVRIFQEVGDQEAHLLEDNRAFHDLVRGLGVPIRYREYTGGHDFACWRIGLLDAVADLFPPADITARPARQGVPA